MVVADQAANVIRAEMIMLPQVGGFWLREAALFDNEGVCLAVASLPPSYKPLLKEGSGRLQALNMWISVSSTADVQLMTDPTVVLASVDEVNRAKNEAKDYADQVAGQLDTDIQQVIADAITAAKRDFWEDDNPVGTTRFLTRTSIPMSAGRGRNGCTRAKTKRSVSERLTVRTSGRAAAAITSHFSRPTCPPFRLT